MFGVLLKIASSEILDEAYDCVCRQRKDYCDNADVWSLRFQWVEIKLQLQWKLQTGDYEFFPLTEFRIVGEEIRQVWCAQDAIVLKALAMVMGEALEPVISDRCFHIKGNGGAKGAVREVTEKITPDSFVMKSDVRGYYANIDHHVLYELVEKYICEPFVCRLIWRYMNRVVCYGGVYWEETKGISLGCSLSPLMGALYLKPLDDKMKELDVFYARFMDDWIVIAPSRWKLKKAIRIVNKTLNELKVEKHPDKTMIGRGNRGFDFLGYFIKPEGILPAVKTIKNFTERITRLYEQGADNLRIECYVRRWLRWFHGGNNWPKSSVAVVWGTWSDFIKYTDLVKTHGFFDRKASNNNEPLEFWTYRAGWDM